MVQTAFYYEGNKFVVAETKEKAFELAINAGSNDCVTHKNYHEIITKKGESSKNKILS